MTIDFDEGHQNVPAKHVFIVLRRLFRFWSILYKMLLRYFSTIVKLTLQGCTFAPAIIKTAINERTTINLIKVKPTIPEVKIRERTFGKCISKAYSYMTIPEISIIS
jgi:hypothetical protein